MREGTSKSSLEPTSPPPPWGTPLDKVCAEARTANAALLLGSTINLNEQQRTSASLSQDIRVRDIRVRVARKDPSRTYAESLPDDLTQCRDTFTAWAPAELWTVQCDPHHLTEAVDKVRALGIPCVPNGKLWTEVPELERALVCDADRLAAHVTAKAETALAALLGPATIFSRDTLKRTNGSAPSSRDLSRGHLEVVVASDRRLLLVRTALEVSTGRTCAVKTSMEVTDLGTPRRVVLSASALTIECSAEVDEPVHLRIDGRQQIAGYRKVPRNVALPDPVSASVLLSLVELGASHLVEMP